MVTELVEEKFLKESSDVTKRLLSKLVIGFYGSNKGRIYYLIGSIEDISATFPTISLTFCIYQIFY